jgi:hypothetical protein
MRETGNGSAHSADALVNFRNAYSARALTWTGEAESLLTATEATPILSVRSSNNTFCTLKQLLAFTGMPLEDKGE